MARRSPTDAEIEDAIEMAYYDLGWFQAWFTMKDVQRPDVWIEALNCLINVPEEFMPEHVRRYIKEVLHQLPGRLTYAGSRDVHIVDAVHHIMERGFRATRNAEPRNGEHKRESACSIVAKALARLNVPGMKLSERNVEAIWLRDVRENRARARENRAR
jgi:hypothetical protein